LLGYTWTVRIFRFRHGTTSISGMRRGRIESATRFASFSSASRESGTPRTFFEPSSTPITTVPPAVLANATRVRRIPSGDDRSHLYSRVFPSLRSSSSLRFTTPQFTRKQGRCKASDFRYFRYSRPDSISSPSTSVSESHRPIQPRRLRPNGRRPGFSISMRSSNTAIRPAILPAQAFNDRFARQVLVGWRRPGRKVSPDHNRPAAL